jgi:3alpha(or 20beta)-hydroxysteroid dehydrogenase
MGRLEGKVALISGAARGQGAAEARAFVAEGAQVVLGDVLDDDCAAVAAELGGAAIAVHLDVTDPGDWKAAVDQAVSTFGKLTTLINNAGIFRIAGIEEMSLADYLQVVQVNQVGCFLGMQAAIPALRAAGGGSIVNTSSTAAQQAMPGLTAYAASKAAVRGMTKCAALDLGHDGIRVNAVLPGSIDTPMVRQGHLEDLDVDALFAGLPIPRIGRPTEVAAMMVFLASDESAYSTGAEFVVDGGMLAGQIPPGEPPS